MKALTALLLVVLTAGNNLPKANAAAPTNDTSFIIKGTIAGMTTGKAVLNYIVGQQVTADTSIISNHHFSFTGTMEQPQEVQVSFINKDFNGAISFFADNRSISIRADTAALNTPVIDGSPAQKEFELLRKQLDTLEEKYLPITTAALAISADTVHLTKAVSDSLYLMYKMFIELEKEKAVIMRGFVRNHPASVVSPWVISRNLLGDPLETLEPLYNMLSTANKESIYGRYVHETIVAQKATAIGKPAIAFSLPNVQHKTISLASFKGKYVLVDFWASWCGPCRAENPHLVKAYTQFKSKGFEILGISLDTDKGAWVKAIEKDKLVWTQVSDLKGWQSPPALDYKIRGIPFNVLLNKNGVIIARNLRGDALENKLSEIFK